MIFAYFRHIDEYPAIFRHTLVLLFGPEPWDGPMSIHEMLADVEEELLPFIADYRINLIAPASVDAESMNRFQSSLRKAKGN